MKLEINHRKRNEKKTITWRLNNMLLKNQWIKVKVASDSLQPHRLFRPRNSPGQNTGVCSLSPLQGIFPTQGSNPGLPHCRWILYQLSHQGRLGPWASLPKHWEILPGGGPAQGGLQDMGASSGPQGTHGLPRTATLNKG